MSVFARRRAPAESRSITSVPFNRGGSAASMDAGMPAALRLIPLYAATSMITDSIATCPLRAYDGLGAARRVSPVQPQLVTDPGPYGMDLVTWLGQCCMSLLLRGNAYGVITATDSRGYPATVQWLHPDVVTVDETHNAAPIYRINGREIDSAVIEHVRGVTLPGSVVGLSPVGLFRAQIETGLRAGELARNWYADGVAPQAILYNKSRPLEPGEAAAAKALLKEATADHDVLVTGNDWGWLPLSVTPEDAMFLEQIQATATEIAAVYHMAPEDIGGKSGESMTYSTLESNDARYARRAVLPWVTRVEAAFNRNTQPGQYVKFGLDHLARADLKTRMDAHAVALDNGILTLDECRALEDRPPLTDDEIAAWQEHFVVPRPNGAGDTGTTRKLAAAEVAQKIYLAAGGQVLTSGEGRQLLAAAGFPIDIPGPDFKKGTP